LFDIPDRFEHGWSTNDLMYSCAADVDTNLIGPAKHSIYIYTHTHTHTHTYIYIYIYTARRCFCMSFRRVLSFFKFVYNETELMFFSNRLPGSPLSPQEGVTCADVYFYIIDLISIYKFVSHASIDLL